VHRIGDRGLASLRDLPDLARLEDAGLLGKAPLPEELRGALGIGDDDKDGAESAADEDSEGDQEYAGVGLFEEGPLGRMERPGANFTGGSCAHSVPDHRV
jgi:hypothetical protein